MHDSNEWRGLTFEKVSFICRPAPQGACVEIFFSWSIIDHFVFFEGLFSLQPVLTSRSGLRLVFPPRWHYFGLRGRSDDPSVNREFLSVGMQSLIISTHTRERRNKFPGIVGTPLSQCKHPTLQQLSVVYNLAKKKGGIFTTIFFYILKMAN